MPLTLTIEISDVDLAAIRNDVVSAEAWVNEAVAGKIAACRKRLVRDNATEYLGDPSVTDEDSLITAVVSADGYMARAEADAEFEAA